MWDFETEPEYQEKLDWVDVFVRDEAELADGKYAGVLAAQGNGRRT